MIKKTIKKSPPVALEKVEERITHYEVLISQQEGKKGKENSLLINKKLLSFWTNYKLKNYK